MLRLSYGRGREPLRDAGSAGGLTELAVADAATLTGVPLTPAAVVDTDIVRWASALPRPQAGHRVVMDAVRSRVEQAGGLYLTGSVVAGTGLAAVVADARKVAAAVVAAARGAAPNSPAPDVG